MICNSRSGRSAARGKALRLELLLSSQGAICSGVPSRSQELGVQLYHAEQRRPDVLVAIGGDGTVQAAATIAIRTNAVLLVVPAGTLNLVARDLAMPLDFRCLLDVVPHMVERRIDYARVNDEVFLHSSLVGIVPALAQVREAMREKQSVREWLSCVRKYIDTIFSAKQLDARLTSDRGEAACCTRCLAVTCGRMVDSQVGKYPRSCLDEGVLGVYASKHRGFGATERVLLAILDGKFNRDRNMNCGTCRKLRVQSRKATMLVSNDGETKRMTCPLCYKVVPNGLRVLRPRVAPEGTAS